jgi:hypothetical protein
MPALLVLHAAQLVFFGICRENKGLQLSEEPDLGHSDPDADV